MTGIELKRGMGRGCSCRKGFVWSEVCGSDFLRKDKLEHFNEKRRRESS